MAYCVYSLVVAWLPSQILLHNFFSAHWTSCDDCLWNDGAFVQSRMYMPMTEEELPTCSIPSRINVPIANYHTLLLYQFEHHLCPYSDLLQLFHMPYAHATALFVAILTHSSDTRLVWVANLAVRQRTLMQPINHRSGALITLVGQ